MIIRTNVGAMKAQRQVNLNNNSLGKSLKKLASGYKINSAADDAAGLTISEAMKAQIKGLEAASLNSQDGISLVQTAEGALSEIHDMLNRMSYISTRAANGIYTSEQRMQYQAELTQLKSEIDRVSESTTFNEIKLLDGSQSMKKEGTIFGNGITNGGMSTPTQNVTETGKIESVSALEISDTGKYRAVFEYKDKGEQKAIDITFNVVRDNLKFYLVSNSGARYNITGNVNITGISSEDLTKALYLELNTRSEFTDKFIVAGTDGSATAQKAGNQAEIGTATGLRITSKEAGSNAADITGISITTLKDNDISTQWNYSMKTGEDIYHINALDSYQKIDFSNLKVITATDAMSLGIDGKTPTKGEDTIKTVIDKVFEINGFRFALANAATQEDMAKNAKLIKEAGYNDVHIIGVTGNEFDIAKDGAHFVAEVNRVAGTNLKFAERGIIGFGGIGGISSGTRSGWHLFDLWPPSSDGTVYPPTYEVLAEDLVMTSPFSSPYNIPSTVPNVIPAGTKVLVKDRAGNDVYHFPSNFGIPGGTVFDVLKSDKHLGIQDDGFYLGKSREEIENAVLFEQIAQIGTATGRTRKVDDGTVVLITETDYSIMNHWLVRPLETGDSAGSATFVKDGITYKKIIDLDTVKFLDYSLSTDANKDRIYEIDGKYFTFLPLARKPGTNPSDHASWTTYRNQYGNPALDDLFIYAFMKDSINYSSSDYASHMKALHFGEGETVSVVYFDLHGDEVIPANTIYNGNAGEMLGINQSVHGDGLVLQIGDTNDEFNKLYISIDDMRSKALGLDKVNISTTESAANSMAIIRKAIDKVSSQRAYLGSIQNRLEHTINNLDTMSENITAANSRIRDTDMASEMTNYTKLNVLVQSAQSMLAQANQSSQAVLSLLR